MTFGLTTVDCSCLKKCTHCTSAGSDASINSIALHEIIVHMQAIDQTTKLTDNAKVNTMPLCDQ